MCPPLKLQRDEFGISTTEDPALPDIIDTNQEVMASFYTKWAERIRGQSTQSIRIGVYGDSNMTMDWITGSMRRIFQKKYGDAGHGFVALGRPWPWYKHMDIRHDMQRRWAVYAVSTKPIGDGRYGFSGIAVEARYVNASTWVETADSNAEIGQHVKRIGVYYLIRPKGGIFEIRIDGKTMQQVDTKGEHFEVGMKTIEVDDAPHKVEFVTTTVGPVRLFGATFERDEPSIIIDSLGVGALSAEGLARENAEINRQMLALRNYDMVVFLIGTNMFAPTMHPIWMKKVLENHRAAIPNLPILIMSPPDIIARRTRKSDPRIAKVGEQLREIAKENHCAFWDFREAMGGEGSILEFRKKKFASPDLVHLTQTGAAYMGQRIVQALWNGLLSYAQTHPDLGCVVQ